MGRITRAICFFVVLVFIAGLAVSEVKAAPASSKAELKRQEKARKAEELKEKKEAAARAKREKKAQEAAKAKAKREAKIKAKADAKARRAREAEMKIMYAKAKKQRDAAVARAKKDKAARLGRLDARSKKETAKLAKELQLEKAGLKKKLESDKVRATSDYKRSLAAAKKNKKQLDAEYKKKVVALEADYRSALANIEAKAKSQSKQTASEMKQCKAKVSALSAQDKRQAKSIKVELANLKARNAKDKSSAKAKYKAAKADAKKRKASKRELGQIETSYKDSLKRLAADYSSSVASVNEKANAQDADIATAKAEQYEMLNDLEASSKEQAKAIKEEKSELKNQFEQDKKMAHGISKLKLEYEGKIEGLEATYKDDVAKVDEKMALHKAQIAKERQQIISDYDEKVAIEDLKLRMIKEQPEIATVTLPADDSPVLNVKEIRIKGNILVPATEIYGAMPLIYNSSDKPLSKAESDLLYDFRVLLDIIVNPGQPRQVSSRTIKGFTEYILSQYQNKDFAGIYVYVPKEAMVSGTELRDDLLQINVLEAPVTEVSVKTYDPDQNVTAEGYLKQSYVEKWSPVQPGEVANQKELDDFVNLLNENPDRYVSAVVTKGAQEQSLAVGYDIYEASPWHFFVQADSAGTKDRKWTPRIGMINTNLLGVDDTFTAIYQAPWEHGIEDEWSVYGSYDRPIWGPKLRLNVYAGYSQFDTTPAGGGIDFIGTGSFVGGALRWNVLQRDDWFLDLLGTMDYFRSKITPSIFPQFLASNVRGAMIGWGSELYHSDDLSDTKFTFNVSESFDTSSQASYNIARGNTVAPTNFRIYTASASHSQILDPNKITRLSGNFRWIDSSDRLVPTKMTTFGGLYTVRGYVESDIVADGGILASVQYEYDLVKHQEAKQPKDQQAQQQAQKGELRLKKLAPLVFWDYGRAIINDSVANEKGIQDMCSFGAGALAEIGDNFSGGAYYGIPTTNTDDTNSGKGRWHFSVMYRW
ncbi:MAG: ShlB/FhaC/HecB family hemolysin secretion/activation protein [Planctomycetota bacterium]